MSSKHQIYVYRCKTCLTKTETMDSRYYKENQMKEYPETYACCDNPELKEIDRYLR